jgi:hypothetical protein
MSTDPFEKFERSRGGLIIPLAVFVLGGCLTYAAVRSLRGVFLRQVEAAQRLQSAAPDIPADPDVQGGSVSIGPGVTAPDENAAGENVAD